MRVLITGIAGFVGSHLAEAYTEAGHDVDGVDTLETGKLANWDAPAQIDIVDRASFYGFANDVRPELVVHCAASYKDPDKWHRDTDVNTAGAINVAAVAKHHDADIIYFQPVLPPISSYAISKIAGEHYLRLSGQPLTVFRLASVYGPRNLSGPIPALYRKIRLGEPCTVVEDVTRDFVFIADLVNVVTDGKALAPVMDIRSGREVSIRSLPGLIGDELGVEPQVAYQTRREDDVQQYDMNGTPLQDVTPFEAGLAETIAWYEEHGVVDSYTHLSMKA